MSFQNPNADFGAQSGEEQNFKKNLFNWLWGFQKRLSGLIKLKNATDSTGKSRKSATTTLTNASGKGLAREER